MTNSIPGVEPEREPDAGTNRYRKSSSNPDGALVFRREFMLNKLEPPADRIRKLLTTLEFADEFTPEVKAEVEAILQQIEAIIDEMRLAVHDAQ